MYVKLSKYKLPANALNLRLVYAFSIVSKLIYYLPSNIRDLSQIHHIGDGLHKMFLRSVSLA